MYKEKYLKYKAKYTALKNQLGGFLLLYDTKDEINKTENKTYNDINFKITYNPYEIVIENYSTDDNISVQLLFSKKQFYYYLIIHLI